MHRSSFLMLVVAGCACCLALSCGEEEAMKFSVLPATETGIDFANRIQTNDTFNALTYEYIYNGAGVGIGDLNGDGFPDVYLAGNQVSSRLYLNRGSMVFDDVTTQSHVGTSRWCTGVSIADINNDGRNDIYVAVAGFGVGAQEKANLLFVNEGNGPDGIPRFTESAEAYGLADTAYTSQVAFLDYDLDGDLDAYILNNALEAYNRNRLRTIRSDGSAPSTDRLYRNDGNATFTDVTLTAGMGMEGYGLGVAVSDLNGDGWPDIYVANDFLSNDLTWINNKDGTFTDRSGSYFRHTSHNGMGVDIADLNNDLLPDIMELDMLPEGNYRQKMMIPYVNRDRFSLKSSYGYRDQYMRNTLQLNRGPIENGEPRFTEIGNLAGVSATDWSWATLLADFDLDGRKDIFVTNGYRKDVTNLDFISYGPYNQLFGDEREKEMRAVRQLASIEEVPLPNYFFRNVGDYRFEDRSEAWEGLNPSFSTGVAYGDLDMDGDIDLVVNNIDDVATVMLNQSVGKSSNRSLTVSLTSGDAGVHVFHTRVLLYTDSAVQVQELYPVRGYLSSVEPRLFFGLGDQQKVDSVVAVWNNGHRQRIVHPSLDTVLAIAYDGGPNLPLASRSASVSTTPQSGATLPFVHREIDYDDFRTTYTLPHGLSRLAPVVTTADIDGDGLEDMVVGGSPSQGIRWLQAGDDGKYTVHPIDTTLRATVTDALLFDADGDGDRDLYAVMGGTQLPPDDPAYRDRLYRNDGSGIFTLDIAAVPSTAYSGSCVRAADIDSDGDPDLFVGTRVDPGHYPLAAPSQLLRNDGGTFVPIQAPLDELGMVTDARWIQNGEDDRPTLVVAAEWEKLRTLRQKEGEWEVSELALTDRHGNRTTPGSGWWFHLNAADMDGDGDLDLIAGNLGHNSFLKASPEQPLRLFAKDFDGNGALDPLLFHYDGEKLVPLHERDLLLKQIPSMKRRFPDYASYARAGLDEVLTEADREGSLQLQATDFTSYYLENMGQGKYRAHRLPAVAQFGPVRGSVLHDFTGDGSPDMFLTGNLHQTEITQIGKYDGNYGTLLVRDGTGGWAESEERFSLPLILGDANVLLSHTGSAQRSVLVGTYGDTLRSYPLAVQQSISR